MMNNNGNVGEIINLSRRNMIGFEMTSDELSRSIKSMLNITIDIEEKPSINEIMEDFAKNGRICDEDVDGNKIENEQIHNTNMAKNKRNVENENGKFYKDCSFYFPVSIEEKAFCSSNKNRKTPFNFCVFCSNNGEPTEVVKSHAVRDALGKVLCPRLRIYICPLCGGSGDNAHTIKYCPRKPIITMEETIRMEKLRKNIRKKGIRL